MDRRQTVRRAGIVVLVANLCLALLKGGVWWRTGSLAVGSEAINSLSDTVYSLVVLAGLHLTTQPPDFEHPHGHERIEPFVSLFIALGIFAAGFAVLWQATTTLLSGNVSAVTSPLAAGVLAVSAFAKYGLYRYCLSVGREQNSPATVAAAQDNRNDILTAAAAFVGVLGGWVGLPLLDPVAAGVVSIGILYTGVQIVRDNVNYLVGAAPPEDLRAEIVQRALSHPDVEGVHDVIAHYVGPEIDVSLHIEVEGDMTLLDAHTLESEIVGTIGAISGVDDVFVHIDPKELGEWKADEEADRLAHYPVDDGPTSDARPTSGESTPERPPDSRPGDAGR